MHTKANPTVLISGAGIGGTTLAYWLARHGFRPTIVERAAGLRSSGNPVDVRGPAVRVAERMGVMPRLRQAATQVTAMSFVNGSGRQVGRVNMRALQQASGSREVEVTRTDLAAILYEASQDAAEIIFGDTMTALNQDDNGVDVTFEKSPPRRFDLVVGADGPHSTTRRLAFGPESRFVRHMGLYVATMPLDGPADNQQEVVLHNAPGRLASIHPVHGRALAAFVFRHPPMEGFNPRDLAQHKQILTNAYAGDGWRVPDLLDQARAAKDLWFDSVSQVRLGSWANDRVALVGDAASSVSLFGDGSTLAMVGAYTLAEELAATPADPHAAFADMRPHTAPWSSPGRETLRRPPHSWSPPPGPASPPATWQPGSGRPQPPPHGSATGSPRPTTPHQRPPDSAASPTGADPPPHSAPEPACRHLLLHELTNASWPVSHPSSHRAKGRTHERPDRLPRRPSPQGSQRTPMAASPVPLVTADRPFLPGADRPVHYPRPAREQRFPAGGVP
ncbi:FAD-dependent monooxygenase [Nonomuraea basaltis]|uniref:FAD-dependent monooxygenase n=1 Tax=Nonomuraea basaltis TaxID=2495887 RepID=UPI00197FA706|nr:FAD-dependent monooxygenase [Nonomuraea basaltis]